MDINISPFNGLDYRLDLAYVAFNLLPQYYKYLTNFRLLQSTANQNQLFWNNVFLNDRFNLMQETYVNNQTSTFEAYLNEKFDFVDRRIEIINASSQIDPAFLYKIDEVEDTDSNIYLYRIDEEMGDEFNTYLYGRSESILDFDFKILVPNELISLGLDIEQLKAIVDKYKLFGTTYVIEYFT